jgi:hypothetical protein
VTLGAKSDRRRRLGAWLAAIVVGSPVFASPAPLHAEEPEAAGESPAVRSEASARFKRALELFNEDNFAAALIEFRRAYELTRNYRVLYNIGQVCFQIHDYVCALDAFQGYLASGGADVTPERAAEVQRDIATLRPRIGRVTVTTSVPGADVSIDDVPRGMTPLAQPIALSAGRHWVTARKAGMQPATRPVDIAGADALTVELELSVVSAEGPRDDASPGAPRPAEPSRWTTLSWVGVGTAGALGVGAAVTGVVALNRSNQLSSTQYVVTPDDHATSLRSQVKTLALASDVLSVAAVATLGATLVWTFTHRPAPAAPAPGVAMGLGVAPGGIVVQGQFQ